MPPKSVSIPGINEADLKAVMKPAQYLGGEVGSIDKSGQHIDLHICLAFPDTYEVGMSHVGMQILYEALNRMPRVWAERAYVPQQDMELLMRTKGIPLFALESKRPLSDFDVIGFSLQYELCMNGILTVLSLSGIPLTAAERTHEHPLIIGGGPVCYHPEPFADFFDAFLIGDGEELVPEFMQALRGWQAAGLTREQQLEAMAGIEGVYVPGFFEVRYDESRNFTGFTPKKPGYSAIRRRVIASLEGAVYSEAPIVPNIKAIHDRLSVEVMRGCVRGCRFCQAGYLYRPQRERKPEDILRIVDNSLQASGYEELSLLSLSTADYCSILPLLGALKDRFAKNDQLAISFPSTRVDSLKPELLQEVQSVRRSGFTIAPEAGTQRLRDVINKGVTEEELMETCRNVFKLGWQSIKMYFMIGLPTETDEDLAGIVDLARKVKAIAGRGRNTITVSVSTLVPKPHTPFQWAEQISEGETIRRQQFLFRELKKIRVNFRYHDAFSSFLEGVFARGDRKLGAVIKAAFEKGCRLDGWVEEVSRELWLSAFEECGIDPAPYLGERPTAAELPWDHISCDIPKRYFLKEWERAVASRVTPDCLTATCSTCGACDYDGKRNVLFDRERSENRLGIVQPPWLAIIEKRRQGQTENLLEQPQQLAGAPAENEAPIKEKGGAYQLREYLRTETDVRPRATFQGDAPPAARLRLRYTKCGSARFYSHLELASIFFRAGRRAGLPIAFSKGFNPKPKLSFGPPLQLGVSSNHELVDVYFTEQIEPEALICALNSTLAEGLRIEEALPVALNAPSIQASVCSQTYRASIAVNSKAGVEALFSIAEWQDRTIDRVRKRNRRSAMRLGEGVRELSVNGSALDFCIPFDSTTPALKPLEIIGAVSTLDPFAFDVEKIHCQLKDSN